MTKAVLKRDCFTCAESHVWLQCSACCSGGAAWPAAGAGGVAEGGEDKAWGDSHSSRVISLSCGGSGRSCLEGSGGDLTGFYHKGPGHRSGWAERLGVAPPGRPRAPVP